jgi:hypothetical protein
MVLAGKRLDFAPSRGGFVDVTRRPRNFRGAYPRRGAATTSGAFLDEVLLIL